MPLELVKEVAEPHRTTCDIEFIEVENNRLFSSSDGGKIKVKIKSSN